MTHSSHTSPDLPAPAGPYSHVRAAAGLVWTAGFGSQDPQTGAVAKGVTRQTEQVIDNVEAALRVQGLGGWCLSPRGGPGGVPSFRENRCMALGYRLNRPGESGDSVV